MAQHCEKSSSKPEHQAAILGEASILGVILLVAIYFRFYELNTIPTGLLYDEAANGVDILAILRGARPVFLTANFGREALFIYLQAVSVHFLGRTDFALRVVSAVVGTLTIGLAHLLTRQMFGSRVALLMSAWLSVSPWLIIFSRIGLRSAILPLFCAGTFFCFWRALADRTERSSVRRTGLTAVGWFALAGGWLGLSLYTYTAARFLPLVVVAFGGYLWIFHRRIFREVFPGLALLAAVAIVVFAPEGLFFLAHPTAFAERADQVSIFNSSLSSGGPGQAFLQNAVRALEMIVVTGDAHWDRNISGSPIFDPISAVFLVVGTIGCIYRIRHPRFAFLLLWIVVMLGPSVLAAKDAPNFLRATGLVPGLFMLPALGVEEAWGWSKKLRFPSAAVVASGLAIVGYSLAVFATSRSYFGLWANAPEVRAVFNSDRWTLLVEAQRLAATTDPIFVAAGSPDGLMQSYALDGTPEAGRIRLMEGARSIILPPPGPIPVYLFADSDPPPADLARTIFEPRTEILSTSGPGPIIVRLFRLKQSVATFTPTRPLAARVADALEITGFDLPRDVKAGESFPIRWYWRILQTDSRNLTFFNQLIDHSGTRRGQLDDRPFAPAYWPAGATGVTTFDVPVDSDATTAAASLFVGVYDRSTMERLPVIAGPGLSAVTQIDLGPIKVHGQSVPAPTIAHRQSARFADGIDLVGYDVAPNPGQPGQPVTLTLDWASRSRPGSDYTVFVHLIDRQGRLVGQADGPPVGGKYPTTVWDPGEIIADSHVVSLDPKLPAGTYRFEIGLYQPATGQRLSILDSNGSPVDDRAIVGELAVR